MKRVAIVTTNWDQVEKEVGDLRQAELEEDDLFFKHAHENGARSAKHDNTLESAERIIRTMIGEQPEALAIQREMVDEGKEVAQTAAGQDLQSALEDLKREHQKEVDQLKSEMEELLALKDRRHDEEITDLRDELRRVQQELGDLRKSSKHLQEQRRDDPGKYNYEPHVKEMAEDMKRLRELMETEAQCRRGDLRRTNEPPSVYLAAVGCVACVGAMVVNKDPATAWRVAIALAKSVFGHNTTSSMEDYVPKA